MLYNLSAILLQAGAWFLLCFTLGEIVPIFWTYLALPVAILIGKLCAWKRLRAGIAIVIIVIFPWLLRAIVFLAAAAFAKSWPLMWDAGWLPTAPFWYFIAIGHYLALRWTSWRYAETLALALFSAIIIPYFLKHLSNFQLPQIESLGLLIALGVFMLVGMNLLSTFLRIHGQSKTNIFCRMVYWAGMLLMLSVLILIGNQLRKQKTLNEAGGVLSSNLFRFNFDDVLTLESEIKLSSELTMLYREDGLPVKRYLRRFTLSDWDPQKGFFRSKDNETDFPGGPKLPYTLPRRQQKWEAPALNMAQLISQEYYLVALDPGSFFAIRSPYNVQPWLIWNEASFVSAYSVDSLAPNHESSFTLNPEAPLQPYREYLLKGGDDPRYKDIARKIIGSRTDPLQISYAIENWLLNNFYYSLKPGLAPDGDQLYWFLTESKRGYCTYFAFAMTRLSRAVGIPARVAVGFFTDPESAVLGFTPVRADQAHAWVEVWLDDYGWTTFDPTSSDLAPGEDYPTMYIDPQKWLPLVEEILTQHDKISLAEDDFQEPLPAAPWWQEWFVTAKEKPLIFWVAAFLILIAIYLPKRIIPSIRNLILNVSGQPSTKVKARWQHFTRYIIRSGYRVKNGETALLWAQRMENAGLTEYMNWTKLYLKAVFATELTDQDLIQARDLEQAVRQTSQSIMNKTRQISTWISPGWKTTLPWGKEK